MKFSKLFSSLRPTALALTFLWASCNFAYAQNLGPDPSFSGDGKFFFSLGSSADQFEDMVIDGLGRIVLVGDTDNDPDEGGNHRGIVVRLLANGTPDITFGLNGVVIIDFPSSNDDLNAVALDNSNNIIVCGRTNIYDAALFKLKATNGALDNSFGIGGRAVLVEGYEFNDVAVLPNQQIVAAGWGIIITAQEDNYLAARFNSNGSLDTSFGTNNGFTHVDIEDDDRVNSMAIESDGDIVLAGYSITCTTNDNCNDLSIVKLKANGQIDTGFGSTGTGKILYKTSPQTGEARIYNVLLQNIQGEEKILLSGYHEPNTDEFAGFLMRLRNNGNTETFGGSSNGFISLPSLLYAVMALQSDNKILLVSNTFTINGSDLFFPTRMMRRNADGTPDNTFGSNGMYDLQIGAYFDIPTVVQAVGNKLYIAGAFLPSNASYTDYDGFVARLVNCGSGPVLSTASASATCGLANGTASVTVSGGGTNTYLWSNGKTTSMVSNLMGGSYTVTVTSAEGCSSTASVTVTALQVANINVTKTDAKCGQNNGNATASLASGPAVTYLWSNGATTATITNLTPGTYTVTATDANFCTVVKSIQISNIPLPVVNIPTVPTSCGNSNGTAEVMLQSGPTLSSYFWSNGQTTKKIQNLASGNYFVTITDINGCTITASTTVNGSVPFTINLGADVTIQQGQTTTINATTSGAISYIWSTGQTTASILVNTAGNYTVTVTNAQGCTATDSKTVNLTTAANDLTQTFKVNVYPNPVDNVLYLESPDAKIMDVTIMDIAGRIVKQFHYSSGSNALKSFDVSDLNAGTYCVQMKGEGLVKSVLVVKR